MDVIALLAIAGAVAIGESFAAAVIAVMLATGEALETYAEGQAHRELTALLGRAPQDVRRYAGRSSRSCPSRGGGRRPAAGPAGRGGAGGRHRPERPAPRSTSRRSPARAGSSPARSGDTVASGVVNSGGPFDMRATATADASTYAGIVRLVEQAGRAKAPFVRLADRYGLLFVPLTLVIAGIAWLVSGDAERALAVLVVATPCPLLLAAPIAIVSGISRAARRGIIVKGGGPLETLARSRVLLFDKTGTLTAGRPRLASVEGPADPDELLRLAAAAGAGVAPRAGAAPSSRPRMPAISSCRIPTDVEETTGVGHPGPGRWAPPGRGRHRGVRGGGGAAAGLGARPPASGRHRGHDQRLRRDRRRDGRCARARRPHPARDAACHPQPAPRRLHAHPHGHRRPERARRHGRRGGRPRWRARRPDARGQGRGRASRGRDGTRPDRHGRRRRQRRTRARRGGRGGRDGRPGCDRVLPGRGHRHHRRPPRPAGGGGASSPGDRAHIALQSVIFGMGLSLIAMVIAAFGYLPVVAGALLQEAIDVAVILNALRALRGGVPAPVRGRRAGRRPTPSSPRRTTSWPAAWHTCARRRTGSTCCRRPMPCASSRPWTRS